VAQLRRAFDLTGCAFLMVDWDERYIRPAAAWFSTPEVGAAFGAVLSRPYDPERAGITEAAIERRTPLLVAGIEEWPGAPGLRRRLEEELPPEQARHTWEWYVASSLLSVPVHAPDGRVLGVLAMSSDSFDDDDLRGAEVFANLAGIALDRSELLHREDVLNQAVGEIGRSLELDDVFRAIVEQAAVVSGMSKVMLTRQEPASRDLQVVHAKNVSERMRRQRFVVGEGMIGRVAATGEPYVSREADRGRWLAWAVEEEGFRSFAHIPLSIGTRLFGVLTVGDPRHVCDEALLARMLAFGRFAAGAVANALDFQRERRVALALTQGFIPGPLPELEGFDAGLVYSPSGHAAGGGDLFGLWRLPSGSVVLLVGDVSGKGIEVAAISAMVRFFIEARTWDAADTAAVLGQTNALLRRRLPGTTFVPVVMAVMDADTIRWCNAGHTPPVLLGADGSRLELRGTGLPLGVDENAEYTSDEAPLRPGDVVFACTDGLTEARREGRQFGDVRLDDLLAEYGRTLDPDALVHRLQREVEEWAPTLDDDLVILALRRRK
jgi:GAF domain-containing protein